MKKKISIITLFMLCLWCAVIGAQAKEEPFSGSRETKCVISQSDLNNFISGGKTSLEMLLVQTKEEWFELYSKPKGTEVELYLKYSFASYEDYKTKTEQLLGYEPITTYGEEEEAYAENFSPRDLFHFLDAAMQKAAVVEEVSFCKLLSVENDKMKMNDEVYEGTKALNTSESSLVKFEQISITTVLEEHIYNRKIKLDISEKNFDRTAHILEQRCKGFSGTFEKGYSDCTITFETDSEKEMIKNTMLLLGTSVNITYEKYSAGKNMVRIEAVERIDVKEILEEEGNFRYEFTVPEIYQNLTPGLEVETAEEQDENPEKVYISQNVISYYGVEGEIRYYYDAPLKFDKVSVSTDLSNELRRIKRTITFYRDWNIADNYHKSTTKQFQKKLKRGETLRIYDENGYRCYEVSYSSWFTSRINRFTDKMFGIANSKLEVKRRAVPFIESKVKDQFNLEKGNVESYSEQIDIEYIVPGNTILVDGDWNYSKEIRFLSFFYRKCILYAIGFLIVILCIWRGICLIQKKKQKANTSVMRTRYCPRCGRERKGGESFCQKCGYKF